MNEERLRNEEEWSYSIGIFAGKSNITWHCSIEIQSDLFLKFTIQLNTNECHSIERSRVLHRNSAIDDRDFHSKQCLSLFEYVESVFE